MLIIKFCICIGVCIWISIIDIRKYTIPDTLLVALFIFFLGMDFFTIPSQILLRFMQGAGMFALFLILYLAVGGLGFGDVKFVGVLAYGYGFFPAVFICLFASFSGLVFFGIQYVRANEPLRANILKQKIPLAPFLTAGSIVVGIVQGFIV